MGCALETDCRYCKKKDTCEKTGKFHGLCSEFERGMEDDISLGLGMVLAAAKAGKRVVEITKSGVVKFPDVLAGFTVNSQDILEQVECEVIGKRPVMDENGAFAASVTIRIELLGDVQEGKKDG